MVCSCTFDMLLSKYYFRFSLLGTIMAILGTALFTSLGTWQVYRAQEKHNLQQIMDARHQQDTLNLNNYNSDLSKQIYAPVKVSGYFDKQNEILIDNEVYNGKAGYHVLTPLVFNEKSVIMIDRGWIALGKSRDVLPAIATPDTLIEIAGTIAPFKSKPALILDSSFTQTTKVWPFYDHEKFKAYTGYDLLPIMIQMDKDNKYGFIRDWPKYDAKTGMHIGYSIQWFAFAIIVLATYLGLNVKKKQA